MARAYLEDLPASHFTEDTIKRMYDLVDHAKTDKDFQKLIYGVVGRAMPGRWKDYHAEAQVVLDWFKTKFDYRRDPYGVELLQDWVATLDRKRFDCDDSSIFLAAAGEVLGAPSRFVTVSTRPDREPSHVYPEVFVGGRWQAMDATVPHSFVGWEPSEITAKKVWSRADVGLSGYDEAFVEGLGMFHNDRWPGPGYWEAGMPFKSDMFVPDLTPGIPNDVSKTYADPWPGELMYSKRIEPGSDILSVADRTSNERPGGGAYNPHPPIASHSMPGEIFGTIPREEVPKILDPREAWWGTIHPWSSHAGAMYPNQHVMEMDYMDDSKANFGGLGQGIIPTFSPPIPPATASIEQATKDIAGSIAQAVSFGLISKESAQLLIDIAVKRWLEKRAKAYTPPPPPPPPAVVAAGVAPSNGLSKWLIPAAVVGVVLVAGGAMAGKKRR